jgi:hypothetical protein
MQSAQELPSNPLMDRNPGNIVGTSEWAKKRNFESYLETGTLGHSGLTRNQIYSSQRRKTVKIAPSGSEKSRNEELIDNILDFVYKNGWQQIEGGEHHQKWINTKYYPEKIFETSSIVELTTGETHYFPIASTDIDPAGVAMNFRGLGNGSHFSIVPNRWIHLSESRRGKRTEKYNEYCKRREKRKMEFSVQERKAFAKKLGIAGSNEI